MSKIYLVDGSGYIFRAFYAVQPLSTKAGLPTNALFGFMRMLVKLIEDLGAEHLAVAFDTGADTFRHELYDEYKANREECPAELVPQMPYFRKIVRVLGIPCFEQDGFEADDIIATLTMRAQAAGHSVVIVSGDKDLTQLVNAEVEVWDAMRDVHYTPAAVFEKFGVAPKQIGDYLAIVGDSSDNVPGVKGVGPKGAQRLLEHFGTIEQMIERSEEIEAISGLRGAKGIRAKVESSVEILRLSKRLVELNTEVTPFSQMQIPEAVSLQTINPGALDELCNELEFESLRAQLVHTSRASHSGADQEKRYHCITSETFPEFLASLHEAAIFAFDTETTSLDVLEASLIGMSFSWNEREAYYLPFQCPELGQALDRDLVLAALKPVFENSKQRKVAFHAKYDIGVLQTAGVEVKGLVFDPLLASYVLRPDIREHGLSALSLRYLREPMRDYEVVIGSAESLAEVPLEAVCQYACHDADVTWRLYVTLYEQLLSLGEGEHKPLAVLEQIEVPLVPVLAAMERVGVAVDVPFLQSLEKEFCAEAERLQIAVFELAGGEFNLNSPKQLSEILFDKLGLSTKGVKRTKTGFSTDASVLQRIVDQHPIIDLILQYREVHKLNSTYVEALQRLVHPLTGRIHTSFNQAIAATGRLSSSDPNLQNIPIRNPRGRRIRSAFIAADGMELVSADYSQIELRVLAHLCGDEALCEAFRSDEDIHARTAKELFNVFPDQGEEFSKYRRYAKTINFGIIYGMSSFRLARELGISRNEAERFIYQYFARYPRVKNYFEELRRKSEQLGYVETLFGRRRYVEDLETEGRDAGYASRSMSNAPIQGTAAEIIKLAMIRLHNRLQAHPSGARMVLQVHDELVFEVPTGALKEIEAVIISEMESAVELKVPLRVSLRSGKNWGLV